ncbi:MAG: hypothetical protein IT385_25715 [Deltaproteobacteria bacterium]|nr:hypothetical protein [Deltaproteobacteria bacterium]
MTITADAVVVAAGAAIDVSGRGYAGDCTPLKGTCTNAGMTIGNLDNGAGTAMGASHAGAGGGGTAPRAFGDPFAPTTLGGGGGQGSSNSHLGGHGGGRVAIVADRLALDGVVRADGLPATVGNAGGGAGGSIYLLVGELAGDGALSADGGDGGPTGGGSGGGGRVALVYDALDALAPLDLEGASARGGLGLTPDVGGGPGTVWARQAGAPGRLRIDNGGRAHVNEAAPWPELGPVRVASIDLGVATVTGATWLADELAGLRLVRRADRATGTIDGNTATTFETTMALAADDVVVGRRVLDGALVIAGAARVSLLDELVAGALTLEGGAVLTHPVTPGTAVERGLWLEIAGPITIDPSSSIDVTGRGYAGGCSALTGGCGAGLARTLGNTATGSGTNAGGSHGGLGAGASPAAIYGDADDAWTLGSGGGRGSSNSYYGGHGGGRVFLDADALTLLGAIIADGTDSNPSGGGGGGGGGVRVVVDTLAGAGLVRARGGAAVVPGGGGRVRLDGVSDTFSGSIVVDGGGAGAGAGTIVRD